MLVDTLRRRKFTLPPVEEAFDLLRMEIGSRFRCSEDEDGRPFFDCRWGRVYALADDAPERLLAILTNATRFRRRRLGKLRLTHLYFDDDMTVVTFDCHMLHHVLKILVPKVRQ